jgi:uncharacterized protein (DUF433 family)
MPTTVEELLSGLEWGIETSPDVCGGEPCIAGTRIPVRVLEQYRRLGLPESEMLANFASLRAVDLVNAWLYVKEHAEEIDRLIREGQET